MGSSNGGKGADPWAYRQVVVGGAGAAATAKETIYPGCVSAPFGVHWGTSFCMLLALKALSYHLQSLFTPTAPSLHSLHRVLWVP